MSRPRSAGTASARAPRAAAEPGGDLEPRTGNPVAAIERASDVLLHFATGPSDFGITDIANELGMPKAAVHRILTSLRSRDLISIDPATRRYSLGPAALRLGLAYLNGMDVCRLASAELPGLSARTNETATLSVRTGKSRVYVDQVTPQREVIMSVSIGVPYPLHAGASSRAFLAFLPEAEIEAYLDRDLSAVTPATITDPRKLLRELKKIRSDGYARSAGERQSGAASVAAPIRDHLGRPAAVISVCGPADRFGAGLDTCVKELLSTVGQLSVRLGAE